MDADNVLGWVAIGAAASLAGMILPFRRGVIGVVVNLFVGIAGAVLSAALSHLIVPWTASREGPIRLLFAAIGALACLVLVQVAWRWAASASRSSVSSRHAELGREGSNGIQ